ncbi:MAG TPA: hypothetical protein VF403_07225, partial [Kofleriaceae bacterium]
TNLDLDFVGYMPFEQEIDLLEALSKLTIADGIKAHPELQWAERKTGDSTDHYIELPINEYTAANWRSMKYVIAVAYPQTHGTSYSMTTFDKPSQDVILASFTKRWGVPKKSIDKELTRYEWSNGNSLLINEDSVAMQISPL